MQIVRAFSISDYGTEYLLNQPSIEYPLVSEPPTLSGIIDSEISNPPQRTISDVEEHYIEDDLSSLSDVSHIKVSNAPRKHEYGKERVERKGNIYNKLYNAALKGEHSIVKDILENHSTTLMPDENGQTSLYAACIGNHLDIINLLIDSGYDINHQDNDGKTVLHIAFENHMPDLAQNLITQFSADIKIQDTQNWTPLHTAIDRGYFRYSKQLSENFLHQDIGTEAHRHISWIQLHAACFQDNTQDVQFLLAANTDVNHVSSAGHTSLHIAVTKGNIDIVTLLLDHDASVHSVAFDRKTPLHVATDKSDETIIQLLLTQKADPRMKDVLGNTSLHLAVRLKQETKTRLLSYVNPSMALYHACSAQTVRAIIDHSADVNAVNNRGQTALWFACCDGQESFVRILLDTGADPNIADQYGESCLHAAIHGQCSTETIQEILDHGAHVNAANKEGTTPLLLACSIAQLEAVKHLLGAKADPNRAYPDGDACLHAAIAADCSKETIQELIDHGAEVNNVNKRGRTALLLGCFYRQMDSIKVLLEAGANPSIADEEGFSCLHAAIDGICSRDTLQALIDHGAHIDATRKDGTNALLRACTTGQSDSVTFLLESGADVNIAKANGNTCLHEAINGNCNGDALQKIVQQGVDVNFVNSKSETALIHACHKAQAESIKILLEKGADPNISNADDHTCLHAAVHGCCTNETLQEIITHHAHLDAQDTDGATALFLACGYRQHGTIKILLEAGCNPNSAANKGITCLMAAVFAGCSKNIIRSIISHGANVNATTISNESALSVACKMKYMDIIRVLLHSGANPNIAVNHGDTCLQRAICAGCTKEVIQAIIDHSADVNATNKKNVTALMLACEIGNKDAINVLLNAGANPDIAAAYDYDDDYEEFNDDEDDDGGGDTCLHYAVKYDCCTEVLQAIISHGGDVNATNKRNVTPLMRACEKGNKDTINVLLNAGADPNITHADGETCLHDSARNASCSKEVLQAIISHGADVNATDKNGRTALSCASGRGNADAIDVLLKAGADPNIRDGVGDTCLHESALGQFAESSINDCTDVNVTNITNQSALVLVCRKPGLVAVSVLLKSVTDPNVADTNRDSLHCDPIHNHISKELSQTVTELGAKLYVLKGGGSAATKLYTCNTKHNESMKAILRSGADTTIANMFGDTCLHHFLHREYLSNEYDHETLQMLLDHGAPVNATNKNHQTAYMLACHQGNIDAMCAFVNAGADPNITDSWGNTSLHLVAQGGSGKLVLERLMEHSANVNAMNNKGATAIMLACEAGQTEAVNTDAINVLLNAGADPDIVDAYGETCLHCAARNNCCTEIFQAIISHGGDVNATGKNNRTALLIACEKGNKIATNVLLNAGADPNITDCNGEMCLHYAVLYDCCTEILQAVISHGGDVNATNKRNVTALMYACRKGNTDTINVLLNVGADPNIADAEGETCLHFAAAAYHDNGDYCNCGYLLIGSWLVHAMPMTRKIILAQKSFRQ